MTLTIRPCHATDLEAPKALIRDVIDASYAAHFPPRATAFFKAFHGAVEFAERARAGAVLVARDCGMLVAAGSLTDGETFAVSVDPARQGEGLCRA